MNVRLQEPRRHIWTLSVLFKLICLPLLLLAGTARAQPALYFVHVDHLNTPRLVANAAGTAVWIWDQQEPFGDNVTDENPSGIGTFELALRLPGQRYDTETSLYYNYFRDFDPTIGSFKESDRVGLRGGLNTYAYVGGNPVADTDMFGLSPGDIFPTEAAASSDADHYLDQFGSRLQRFLIGPAYFTKVKKLSACPDTYTYSVVPVITGMPPAVGKVGGVIAGYTRHGLNQAIGREGLGVSIKSILNAVRSPTSVAASRGGTTVYTGADGTTVVVNQGGKVVTTYGVPRGP